MEATAASRYLACMRHSIWIAALVVLPCACRLEGKSPTAVDSGPSTSPAGDQAAAASPLSIDRVLELNDALRPSTSAFRGWSGSGHEYLASVGEGEQSQLNLVDALSGSSRAFHDRARMREALQTLAGIDAATAAELSRRSEYLLAKDGLSVLFNVLGDLLVYHFDTHRAVRLTNDAAEEVGEALSPDGNWVSFVRGNNLFVVSSQGGEARALTTEGDETHLFGWLDWVYQEEVYGRGNFQANWWSPDSERLAFLALDESAVPEYTIVDTSERRPKVEKWRYPKVGDPNPIARLGVVDIRGGKPRYFDLEGYPADVLIVRVGWSPDSREVIAQLQDRVQTWLDLVAGDPSTGKLRRLFRESSAAWTLPSDGPFWLDGNAEFVWPSERNGYSHVYLYRRDGTLLRQVTDGPWEVDEVERVDSSARSVRFSGDRADVKGSQLFEVSLDGGEPRQITREPGTHTVSVAPDGTCFVDTFSSQRAAPRILLCDAKGEVLRELARVDDSGLQRHGLAPVEFHKPRTRDGFEMEAMLYKPANFDPARKYPLLCFTYSGPHAPQVRDAFPNLNALYHQMLAQQGILVWVCDNRSASGKGLVSAASAYKKFGPGELADLEDGIDYLCAKGFVDETRIGLWGWSYGGYMTAFALTHSTRFKLGISGAPVTDFRLYDSIYTERYMGLPDENKAGYDAGSALLAADKLSGRLLLICGEIDENVHAQNTLQFAAALQKAGKQFDLMVYPGNRHGIVEPKQRRHLYTMMAAYVREHL